MKIKKMLWRYKIAILAALVMILIIRFLPETGQQAKTSLVYQIKNLLLILPPVFILLGLMDIWVPKEVMVKYLGPDSKIKGFFIAFILGSAAAGPLYGAFPIAAMFMKKGAGFFNIVVFLGAWSTTKIPMFLFELNSMGYKFALARLSINIVGILIISLFLNLLISHNEKESIYKKISTADKAE